MHAADVAATVVLYSVGRDPLRGYVVQAFII